MSKHKHFHSIGTSRKMLQYARREGIGPTYHPSRAKRSPLPVMAEGGGMEERKDLQPNDTTEKGAVQP